ncbi:geraniol 8-hydroxylase-like [Macadamia integrifolia]|uniref:geraniol 8-hydroxylase-like n=1 Tax=Macadamia integrifolia TaxID=60698 RepID=UPI001C4F17EE|nr:geraniol 8-hydroxylase-like [Macadamia integrifolia]
MGSLSDIWWSWRKASTQKDQFTPTLLTLTLAVLFIFWFVWLLKKSRNQNPPLPPGPRPLPLLGNLPFLDPDLHTYFANLARTYGPIFKLHLGNKLGVIVSSPSLAKEVLKDQDTTFANRDPPIAARVATYGGIDIAWSPYGPQWRLLRKVCVREMLGNASLDAVYGHRRREIRQTISYIYSKSGCPVNVGEQMFLTVLNLITSMLWGGTVEGGKRDSLGAEFRRLVGEMTELLGKPNVSDFYPSLARFDIQGVERDMKALFPRLDQIFDSVIDHRLKMDGQGGEECHDFLHFLLKLKDEADSKTPLTMLHLKALLMDMVVGGTDTTSNTVEWAMAEMMNKQETMRKVQEELDRVVGRDNIVEESHLPKLHYLPAVMKEVLRLHAALPLLVPHCPSSSCTIGGYSVPKGARVFVNVWAIHRDPSIWENPSIFEPERFLNDRWDFNGNDFNYFPFGSGRRICAGTGMAERTVMYTLASLLHSFDWRLPEGVAEVDLSEKFGIVLKAATPLLAVPTPRLVDTALYL